MDVIGNNSRNGLGSGYFNFLAAAQVGGALVGARKIKTKKYQNRETEQLAINFPHKLTSEEQSKMLQQLVSQQEKLIQARDKAKGKARAQVVGRLRAYDEYLKDVRDVRDDLAKQEQDALDKLESNSEEMKKTPNVEGKVQLDTTLADVTKTPSENLNTPKKDNTLLYVGLGVGALLLVLIMRKK
jgi:phosphoglycerate-specific signal transduction histidine kinase